MGVVGESIRDLSSTGTLVLAFLGLGSFVRSLVTLVTSFAICGVIFLALTLYSPGCLELQPLHLVVQCRSIGSVHELPQRRHLALVHLPLCVSTISCPACSSRVMCWLAVGACFFGFFSTAGGMALGLPKELFS